MPIPNNTVDWNNRSVRAAALTGIRLALFARAVELEWYAIHEAPCAANPTEKLDDNSPADGRPPMLGADVQTVVAKILAKFGASAITNADLQILMKAASVPGFTGNE